ncbi:hypothetical protein [Haloplanus salilacus]|uniref:hypothetical protein n=1 Tax=Haloplanus salilacus TaxID=2949994 RepID=UPI0030D4423B
MPTRRAALALLGPPCPAVRPTSAVVTTTRRRQSSTDPSAPPGRSRSTKSTPATPAASTSRCHRARRSPGDGRPPATRSQPVVDGTDVYVAFDGTLVTLALDDDRSG